MSDRIICIVALTCLLAGCTAMQLSEFKKRAADGDYAWVAAQTITCRKASDRCGQLHLIKGDACFRLAKAGTAPEVNFNCAADELSMGLKLRPSWSDAATHRQFQENLCESLRNLANPEDRNPSGPAINRLMEAAVKLYRLAPESVPAVFYIEDARLKSIQANLPELDAASRIPACNRLKRSVNRVLATMEAAERDTLPDWHRFARNFQRLSYELGMAINAAECR